MIIHHHLGLGDHFVCNGIVNYFSESNHIDLICKQHNFPTIQTLYINNPNVQVISIPGVNELLESHLYAESTRQEILRIGFDKCDASNWDMSFYKQVGLSFDLRYSLFKLPKLEQLPTQLDFEFSDFIFIHNQSSDGSYSLNIESTLPRFILEKTQTNNLFSYIDLITRSKEIHCIDSSIFHLIDSISNIRKNLYYHDIRKHPCFFNLSKKWKQIKYD
jgi:hypothetical protein